jgi:hypothetical protein
MLEAPTVRRGRIADISVDSNNVVHVLCDRGVYQQYALKQPTKSQTTVDLEPLTIDLGVILKKYDLEFDRIAVNTYKADGLVVLYSSKGLISFKTEDLITHRQDCENPAKKKELEMSYFVLQIDDTFRV